MIYMLMIGVAIFLVILYQGKKPSPVAFITDEADTSALEHESTHAVNIKALTDQPFKIRVKAEVENIKARIGDHLPIKVAAFFILVVLATVAVHYYLVPLSLFVLLPLLLLVSTIATLLFLKVYERRLFETSFPDALNLLNGAISSGESLMHAIIFVGDSLDGPVGREFKLMGQRLSLGQTAEEVLSKSCRRFPYASFHFFVIALRANINRGGQLKEVIHGLTRLMFDNRAIEKKKGAMTSEARTSAKIVCAIPFCFLIIMKFMSPENFDYVMNHADGQPILYYVLVSEAIGMGIIWFLMKRTQA